ncbi:MAG TPA: hypothetical protein VFH06_05895 [Candidatus Saccharimonadales bacterium]|nr:hypothetical protein [Candidatus Saccharimonadales bacterium]
MSKEKINTGPEREINPEALAEAGEQQRERLREDLERGVETSKENLEDARKEAIERASSAEKEKLHEEVEASPAERRVQGPLSKADKDASFNATMKEVRSQMSAPSRNFSKVIHNKTVEKVSESVGSTIARPNAILSGAIFAFALTLGVYLLAKNLGYPLSGFETIAAFILGWVLGVVYDFLKVMVTGRSS